MITYSDIIKNQIYLGVDQLIPDTSFLVGNVSKSRNLLPTQYRPM